MIDINTMKAALEAQAAARAHTQRELAEATAQAVLYLFEELPSNLLPLGAVDVQARLGEALERYQQARDRKR